jgi:MoaA/NifB/PqqE/SkfB family radical SAM enzyme
MAGKLLMHHEGLVTKKENAMDMINGPARVSADAGLPTVLAGKGRTVFIPVAAGMNVDCAYCGAHAPCRHALPFALTGRAFEPDEALDRIIPIMEHRGRLDDLCIAGPGEALASLATRVVLRVLTWRYSGIGRSIWTNGLLLSEQLDELARLGLNRVIITINSYERLTAERLYAWVTYRGRSYVGRAAGDLLLEKQWLGLSLAKDHGLHVTVHSVLVPRVNEADLASIASRAGRLGAEDMILTSLDGPPPKGPDNGPVSTLLRVKRHELSAYLPQRELIFP